MDIPKQYLTLAGRPLIGHAVSVLCQNARIDGVCVVLSPGDEHWDNHDWRPFEPKLRVVRRGGETRAASVLNGLLALADTLDRDDWVLVHDAARPCLTQTLLDSLMDTLERDPVGGLLATPVADTLKLADIERRVTATQPRDGLWQAQTPQMFRYGILSGALKNAAGVTDEAGAVEAAGMRPRLVPADAANLKVTFPVDLILAEWILRGRAGG